MPTDNFTFRPIEDANLFSHGDRVRGKVILITGAATGIGKEAALKFAEHGGKIVIGDRNVSGAEQTVAEITKAGGEASCLSCNVTIWEEVLALFEFTIKLHGAVDVVVSNAGVAEVGQFSSVLGSDGRPKKPNMTTINVNLHGSLYTTQLAQYYFTLGPSGGLKSLVLLGSISSLKGIPGAPMYTASKHAVLGLMRSIHPSLKANGIRVSVVNPFFVDTTILPIPVKLFLSGIPLTPLKRVTGAIFYSATDPDPTTDGSAWLMLDDSPVVVVPPEDFKFGVYGALDGRINKAQRGLLGIVFYIRVLQDIVRILNLKKVFGPALLVVLAGVVFSYLS